MGNDRLAFYISETTLLTEIKRHMDNQESCQVPFGCFDVAVARDEYEDEDIDDPDYARVRVVCAFAKAHGLRVWIDSMNQTIYFTGRDN